MSKPTKPSTDDVRQSLTERWPSSKHAIDRLWPTILEEMLLLFYPPFRAEGEPELLVQTVIALRAYVEDLGEFDGKTLADGWRSVRRSHRTERWPTIETIRSACLDTTARRTSKSTIGTDGKVIPFWREATKAELEILERAGPPFSAYTRVTDALLERAQSAARGGSAA